MATILVVDDEASIRSLLRDFLEMDAYSVLEAEDGLEALDQCVSADIDLVITDIDMPRLDGYGFLRTLRERNNPTPVIIITGKPSVKAAVDCFKFGASDFMEKPLDLAKLSGLVKATLHSSRRTTDEIKTLSLPAMQRLKTIAGYRVARTIGMGSFGVVFQVAPPDDPANATLALKMLRMNESSVSPDSEAVARFLREAEAASRVTHPNIVAIHAYGWAEDGEVPYIVMEYIDGHSLKDHIERQTRWSTEVRIDILLGIARALTAIHACDLVHRDIKPQNILITPDLRPKITDFGIVRMPGSQLTQAAHIVGSPAYMAPEAFVTANIDSRADIFSLGVLGYEMFTGNMPFDGENVMQMAVAITRKRPVEPRRVVPDLPRGIQDILARMLKKSPAERYQTAAELIADLETFRQGGHSVGQRIVNILRSDIMTRDWA